MDVPSKPQLFDLTFGPRADDVVRDPVFFLTAVGVALVTANGIHPVPSATLGDLALGLATVLLGPLVWLRRPSYFTIPRWLAAAVAVLGVTVLISTASNAARASDLADGVKFM